VTLNKFPSKFPSMELDDLLTRPEGKTLEFKRDFSSPDRIIRTLVAFANTAGGTVLVGVEDKTRNVVGVADPLMEEGRAANLVADSILPQLLPEIEILPWRNMQLLALRIHPEWTTPHYVKKLGPERGVFIRVGSSNRQADPSIIAELKRNVGNQSYDEYALPNLELDSLDFELAVELFSGIRRLTRRDMQTLKLARAHRGRIVPTVGGVLLIGKDRLTSFPDAEMRVARFDGTTRADILDMQDIRAPLPRIVDEAVAFVQKHTSRKAVFGGTRRIDQWTIPVDALREAVINCVVHADYSQTGAPLRLALYDDRLEIENPGLLPAGTTIEDIKRGISRPRNRVLARFFRELHLIEQWGSGVRRMTEACIAAGLPEPEFEEIATHFRVTLGMPKSAAQTRSQARSVLAGREETALAFLKERGKSGASVQEITNHLGVTPKTTRAALQRLVARRLAVVVGSSAKDPQRRYFATSEAII